jgi:hypothetical protein
MFGETGYDRYIEFQFNFAGDFYVALFQAIGRADPDNLAKLEKGFPEEVHAHVLWTQFGMEMFTMRVTAGHPLLKHLAVEMRHKGTPDILTTFLTQAFGEVMGDEPCPPK